jgi:hypothetical protein
MHSVRRELPSIGEIWNVLWIHITLFLALEIVAIVRASTSSGGAAIIAIIATAYMALIAIAVVAMRALGTPRRAVSPPAPARSRHRAAPPTRPPFRPSNRREQHPRHTGLAPAPISGAGLASSGPASVGPPGPPRETRGRGDRAQR